MTSLITNKKYHAFLYDKNKPYWRGKFDKLQL